MSPRAIPAFLALVLIGGGCVFLAPVSVNTDGTIAGVDSGRAAVSADGRYVAFTSMAPLVSGDTNGVADVYLRDTVDETTLLVSIGLAGATADGPSGDPAISDDGFGIAFVSSATNLTTMATGGQQQVFVRDRTAGTTSVVSHDGAGAAGDAASDEPAISSDGLVVAFSSPATNLVVGDTNGVTDVFTHVLAATATTRRSEATGGAQADGPSYSPALNTDGSTVVFVSIATNLTPLDANGVADIFTNSGGTTTAVTGPSADGASSQPDVATGSGDIAFTSTATNLVAGDTNGVADVFVKPAAGPIERRSTGMGGAQFAAATSEPSLGADGTRLVALTAGTNVGHSPAQVAILLDKTAATLDVVSTNATEATVVAAESLALSADGAYVAFSTPSALDNGDTNSANDVYVRFTHPTRITWRSMSPAVHQQGTSAAITITGSRFSGTAPTLSTVGGSGVTFSNVAAIDATTVTATITIATNAALGTFNLLVDAPGSAPGSAAGATTICPCVTVVDSVPVPADFVDIAPTIGLSAADTYAIDALVADLDGDADDDVVLVRHTNVGEDRLTNDGGQLSTTVIGAVADRHYCDAADVDTNGTVDLYCSVGASTGAGVGNNNLYLQQLDGSLVDVAAAWGVTDPLGRGRQVVFLHADNDALPDLFVANWSPRGDGQPSTNKLFLNAGGTSFAPAPGFGVDEETPTTCAVAVDFDTDGDDDLVVCAGDRVRMFQNQGGNGFVDIALVNGFNYRMLDVAFGDIDDDGDLDMGVATSAEGRIIRLADGVNDGTVFTVAALDGNKVAAGHVNADTKADFFFVQKGCRTSGEANLPDTAVLSQAATFAIATIPQTTRGCGGTVEPFDHDGDGTDGFIVLNGAGRRGPVQYLTLAP